MSHSARTTHLVGRPDRAAPWVGDRADVVGLVESAQLSGLGAGAICVDLDRFHHVNARWGQLLGDHALTVVLERILDILPSGAVVSPLGDRFIIAASGTDADGVRALSEAALATLREPVQVEGVTLSLGASVGYAVQGPMDSSVDLVEHAFLACRRAKTSAVGSVIGYDSGLSVTLAAHQRTIDGLRRALAGDELRLFAQPTVDLRDGQVVGVEALVRWQHPTDGLLIPEQFLPVAEASGLITPIGDWILDHAICLASRWIDARGGEPMRVWVNLAAQQLADGDRVEARIRKALANGSIVPRSIGFEVTESSLLDDLPAAAGLLSALREMGIEIALDDFGTGYSPLSYLRRLPVTAVKIDRSFVAGIGGSLADEAIVEAVIDLSHALGLRVTAEGIEDVGQAQALIQLGADHAQGYLFGRPEPVDNIERLFGLPWCGAPAPDVGGVVFDRRAEQLPGFGSPRARLLLAALDDAHDSVIVTTASNGADGAPPIVYVNAAFEAETGYRSRDVVGRTVAMLYPDESVDEAMAWMRDAHAANAAVTVETTNRRADGSLFQSELTLSPIVDERGTQTHWLHVRRDLTQRRAAEGDRARFQGLIEQSSSLVFLADVSGQWIYANAAVRDVIGIALDAPLDGITTEILRDADGGSLHDQMLFALQRDGSWSGEATFAGRTEAPSAIVVSDLQLVDDPMHPGGRLIAAVSRDITEIKRLERAEARHRELSGVAALLARDALSRGRDELLVDLDAVLGAVGPVLRVDRIFVDELDIAAGVLRPIGGWSSEQFTLDKHIPTEVPFEHVRHWVRRLDETGMLFWNRVDFERADWVDELAACFPGQPVGMNLYAPLRVGGDLIGVLGMSNLDDSHRWTQDEVATVRQVAEALANLISRKQSDRALRSSEARLTAMLANVGDILIVVDQNGVIRSANERMRERLGHEVSAVVGANFLDFIHPDDHLYAIECFANLVSGADLPVTELRIAAASGEHLWFDIDSAGVFEPLIGGYSVSLRNVSAQHASIESADRKATFERVVLGFSRWALEVSSGDASSDLAEQLGNLGRTLGADAAFAATIDGDAMTNVAGWAAPDAPAGVYAVPAMPLPALVSRLRTTEPLVVEDITTHGEAWAKDWRAFPVCNRSGLNVPLVSEGRCLGIIGVVMNAATRAWTVDEVALLQRVSETVAAMLSREQVDASLRMSEARLAALLDGSLELVVVAGSDGQVMYTNGSVARQLGFTPETLEDANLRDVVHPDDLAEAMDWLAALDRLADTDDPSAPTIIVRLVDARSTVGSWEISSAGVRDPVAGGHVLTCRNVTARLAADAEAAARVEHLRYAFDIAQAALDAQPREFIQALDEVCATIASMLGVDFVYVDQLDESTELMINLAGYTRNGAVQLLMPGQTISFSAVPHWVARLRRLEPIVLDDAWTCDEPWAAEKRSVLTTERGMIAIGMSAAGQLFGVLGVSLASGPRTWTDDEVTFLRIVSETIAHVLDRARVDAALRTSEARFRLLSETAADVVILMDADARVHYISPSSIDLLGFTPEQLTGRPASSLIHPDDQAATQAAAAALAIGETFTSELRLLCSDGSWVWVANSTSCVLDTLTGTQIEYRASIHDISDRKRLLAELEQQALHDPLTGLGNRILLRRELESAASSPAAVAVLMIDLDGFKQVNDTHGHAIGDEVLRVTSARLRSLIRPTDTITRAGGDEFVLICPDAAPEDALRIGERIVAALSQPITVGGSSIRIGASVGMTHHLSGAADPDLLLLEADHAMYAAKRAGRGRVHLAPAS